MQDNIDRVIFDLDEKAAQIMTQIDFHRKTESCLVSTVSWDIRFIKDLIELTIRDSFVKALNSGICGLDSPLSADRFLYDHLGINDKERRRIATVFLTEQLLTIEDEVYQLCGRPTFNLWSLHTKDGFLEADLVGDFRVLEWEREHLDEDGNYVN